VVKFPAACSSQPHAFIAAHLCGYHKIEVNIEKIRAYESFCATLPICALDEVIRAPVAVGTIPIPHLAVYDDGICCGRCSAEKTYVCRVEQLNPQRQRLKRMKSRERTRRGWDFPGL
jgi:hypothetical protein